VAYAFATCDLCFQTPCIYTNSSAANTNIMQYSHIALCNVSDRRFALHAQQVPVRPPEHAPAGASKAPSLTACNCCAGDGGLWGGLQRALGAKPTPDDAASPSPATTTSTSSSQPSAASSSNTPQGGTGVLLGTSSTPLFPPYRVVRKGSKYDLRWVLRVHATNPEGRCNTRWPPAGQIHETPACRRQPS
jgi:hypothetical protein